VKEKLKQLKAQLDKATGAEHVQINVVDFDLLLTTAMASGADESVLERFNESMTRAAMRNEAQRHAINRLLRRFETAMSYLGAISDKGIREMSREDSIRLQTAKKALAGEFDE